MTSLVSGFIGFVAAIAIFVLIRKDHLHVRLGLWWVMVALAFLFLGVFPTLFDALATKLGIASGPVLALTIGFSLLMIKVLTQDIARSNNEARIIRLVQRVAMLEADLERLREPGNLPGPGDPGNNDVSTKPVNKSGV